MSRSDHFDAGRSDGAPRLLYHGTNADLSRGDVILPASSGQKSISSAVEGGAAPHEHDSLAFATESPFIAAAYAERAVEASGGNARVYRVAPVADDVKQSLEDEHSSPSGFKVLHEVKANTTDDPALHFLHIKYEGRHP